MAATSRRVRNIAAKGLLQNGKVVDGKGTVAFPALEVYRARILNALSDLAMDVRALREAVEAAGRHFHPAPRARALAAIDGPLPVARGGLRPDTVGGHYASTRTRR